MATAHYGIKLSDNWVETPEGFLVFRNAVIARTGFQVYKGKELDLDVLREQGLDVKDDSDVNVYRSPEEVFAPATIASFNSKSVTDGHPKELIDVDTVREHECGHVMNVRPGTDALPTGDLPLLGDVIVKDKALIGKMKPKDGLRELSCGYNYQLTVRDSQVFQTNIIGNHVAVVEKGRAGKYARVYDSEPKQEKLTMSEWKKKLFGLGLKAFALDAKPEELAEAMDAMKEADAPKAKDEEKKEEKKEEKAEDAKLGKDEEKELTKAMSRKADDEKKDEDEEEEEEANDEEEEEEANDESVVIAPEDRSKSPVPSVIDSAFAEGQRSALNALKPHIAKSNDPRLKGAFDTAFKLATKPAVSKGSGYGKFAKAASTASDAVAKGEMDLVAQANEMYANARKAYRK